ncbi:MAG: hypothetical protein ACI9J4_001111 [Paraglaciecola sp.]|jgi:hypothetical protein
MTQSHANDVLAKRTLLLAAAAMGFAIVQQTIAFRFQDELGLTGIETAKIVGISLMFSAAAALFVQLVVIPRLSVRPFVLHPLLFESKCG